MKNLIRTLLPVVAVIAACSPLVYGKIDAPSVKITQSLPAMPGVPLVPVDVPENLLPPISFSIGEIVVGEGDQDSSLTLNSASLAMTSTSPADSTTVNFSGISTLTLTIVPPSGSSMPAVPVAKFDKQAGMGSVSADGKTITLAPVGETNLLGYLTQKTLSVNIGGSGTPPGPLGTSWTSDLTLDFHVIAQHNVL